MSDRLGKYRLFVFGSMLSMMGDGVHLMLDDRDLLPIAHVLGAAMDPDRLAHHWWEALRPPDDEWVWVDLPQRAEQRAMGAAAHVVAALVDWKFAAVRLPNIVLGPATSGSMIWPLVPTGPA